MPSTSQIAIDTLAQDVQAGTLRLVVKHHHDYLFKQKGRVVGSVSKKSITIGEVVVAEGEAAKTLWLRLKAALGHSVEGLV